MEYLSGIIFIFFILCALTYISYTAVRSVLDRIPLLSHIRKDNKLFNNGMIFLYSINDVKQVVLPVLEETEEYTRDTYPQERLAPTLKRDNIFYEEKDIVTFVFS